MDFSPIIAALMILPVGMFFYLLLQLNDDWLLPPAITDEVKAPFNTPVRATVFLLGVFGLFSLILTAVVNYTSVLFDADGQRIHWKRISLFGMSWRTFKRDQVRDCRLEVKQRFQARHHKDDYHIRILLDVDGALWPLSRSPHVVTPAEVDEYQKQMDEVRGKLGFTNDPEAEREFL